MAELRTLGLRPEEIVDFSVNINPYGPHPAVLEAVRGAPVDRYPDPAAWEAREALARLHDADPEEIVLGAGSADLLWTLARTLAGRTAVIVEPTFSEFGAACRASGMRVLEWRACAEEGFAVRFDALSALIRRCRADAVYVCLPNNPTGAGVKPAELLGFIGAHESVTFVLDAAFLPLSEGDPGPLRMPGNVVRVWSLTKAHAIPGVRVGYLTASRGQARRIEICRPAWSASAAAQAAARAACRQQGFVAECRRRMLADRNHLAASLERFGLRPVRSTAPFFIVPVADSARLRQRLLGRRILVRDCASFGLPGYIRLAARPPEEVELLLDALREEGVTPPASAPAS